MATDAVRSAAARPAEQGGRTLVVIAVAAAVWAIGAAWIRASTGWTGNHPLDFVTGATYLAAGVYALHRRPGNTVGVLLLLFGAVWFLTPWAFTAYPPLFAWASVLRDTAPALLVHMVLVFPTGRAATAFARGVIVAGYAWNLVSNFAAQATIDRTAAGYDDAVPTISLWPSDSVNAMIVSAVQVGTLILASLTIAAFAQRWALATPAAQRDLRPMWIILALGALVYSARSMLRLFVESEQLLDAVEQLLAVVLIGVPLIVVWGLLRARLATSAVGEVARVASAPLTPAGLESALGRALGDPTLRLHLTDPSGAWIDAAGASTASSPGTDRRTTVVTGARGEPRAALEHDAGLDQSAVDAAAAAAGMALENDALRAQVAAQLVEVQESRARIVEAGYRERRRVERDLHDGAQQRLLSLVLALKTARRQTGEPEVAALIDAASDELRAAIDELREFARGIHPSLLTDAGLEPALRALAARSAVPVTVVSDLEGRLPPGVETTAYFVVAEALANVARHAAADRVDVRLHASPPLLEVEVVDDGRGGAGASGGSGLRGLQDRVEAARGVLRVTSPPGGGTTISASIPTAATDPSGDGA